MDVSANYHVRYFQKAKATHFIARYRIELSSRAVLNDQ